MANLEYASAEDLMEELSHRFLHAQDEVPAMRTLRHALEDQDWKKVEQAARELNLKWTPKRKAA